MAINQPPLPALVPVVGSDRRLEDVWFQFLNARFAELARCPQRIGVASLSAKEASISATNIAPEVIPAGVYRLSYYARISQAAAVSSSLTVSLGWTDGEPQAFTGAAMAGNTTTTYQTGSLLIHIDANTLVTYGAVRASVGGTPMQYGLHVTLDQVFA